MNTFMNQLRNDTNYCVTENGALAHKTTNSAVYDMFALCASYRNRTPEDCVLKFKNALEEDAELAMKCLFYIRDIRGGAGERRFFRVCYKWLADCNPVLARKFLALIPTYGRWDDLFAIGIATACENDVFSFVKTQLAADLESKTPSLLAKWLPSENASSAMTKAMAKRFRKYCGFTSRQYRKILSAIRKKINVLERLMSENRWTEIEFDKIPSKAGLIYKNAFARHDVERYKEFIMSKSTKVNAGALYPYEIVKKALAGTPQWYPNLSANLDREAVNKYWENLPDYFEGKPSSMMCVVDTSGSMEGTPMNIAISLGMYCAERLRGPFQNHYISFSSRPQFIKIEGVDFCDKVFRIYQTNLCENTNIKAVFDLLRKTALMPNVRKEDIPKTIVIISDMEIDSGSYCYNRKSGFSYHWTEESAATEMEKIRIEWAADGLELPRLVYWNADARNDRILDAGPNVSFVSGASPIIFKQIITGKNGYDLMMEALMSDRYKAITI